MNTISCYSNRSTHQVEVKILVILLLLAISVMSFGQCPSPGATLSSTLTPPSMCSSGSPTDIFNYTATSATPGSTFSWSRGAVPGMFPPTGASGTGNVSELLFNTTSSPIVVTYVYTVTANGCTGPAQNVTMTINPRPNNVGLLGSEQACANSSVPYSISNPNAGSSYAWTITPTGSGTGSNITVNWGSAGTGQVSVVETNAYGCSGSPASKAVTISSSPSSSPINGPTNICDLSNPNISYTPNPQSSSSTYSWAVTSGTISNNWGLGINVSWQAPGPGNVQLVETFYAGCVGSAVNLPLTIGETPTLTSTLTPPATCSGNAFNYWATSASACEAVSWSRATVVGIAEPGTSGIFNVGEVLSNTTTSPIVVTYVYTVTGNGCSGSSVQNVTVTVNPSPTLSSTLTTPAICSGSVFNYTATSKIAGATISWRRPPVTGITPTRTGGTGNVSETLTNTTANPIVVSFYYNLDLNGCYSSLTGQIVYVIV